MIYAWLYTVACALGLNIVDMINDTLPASFILSMSCFIASIISLIIFRNKNIHINRLVLDNFLTFVLINITTLLVLISSYFSVVYIPVSTYLILFFSFSTIIKSKTINFSLVIIITACFLELLNLSLHYKDGYIMTIIITFIGAIANNIFLKYSKKVSAITNDNKIILSLRYWLTAFTMLLITKMNLINNNLLNTHNVILIFISAILCLIIPIYFSTKAVSIISTNKFILIAITTPFLAIIAAIIMGNSWFLIDLICGFFLLIGNISSQNNN